MARTPVFGRILALLAVAALVPACDDDTSGTGVSTGGGIATPMQWNSTTAAPFGGGTGAVTPLLWIDPNLGPTGPIGGGGALTYGDMGYFTNPQQPEALNALCTPQPQNQLTDTDEVTLEGYVTAYWATTFGIGGGGAGVGGLGGLGGGIGGGIGGGANPVYNTSILRPTTRAYCQQNVAPGAGANPVVRGAGGAPGLAQALTDCGVTNYIAGTEAELVAQGAGLTVGAAWNQFQTAAQGWVNGNGSTGWVGGGSWQGQTDNCMSLLWVETQNGQTP